MGDCEVPEISANLTICIYADLVNNGECNIETENSELCDNDGNDCQEPIPAECQTPDLIGDGVCHDNLLDESCSYDGDWHNSLDQRPSKKLNAKRLSSLWPPAYTITTSVGA